MAAARGGDTTALETLLVRYQPQLYRFGFRMCGNAEDAGPVMTRQAPTCPDVLTLFSQHLEGDIDPAVCATMEAHDVNTVAMRVNP